MIVCQYAECVVHLSVHSANSLVVRRYVVVHNHSEVISYSDYFDEMVLVGLLCKVFFNKKNCFIRFTFKTRALFRKIHMGKAHKNCIIQV